MIKRFLFLIIVSVLLSACGGDTSETVSEDNVENVEEEQQEETVEEESKKPEKKGFETKIIKINDELSYPHLKINFNQVKLYEKKGKKYADIEFDWTNLSGDEFSLQALAKMDVQQNGESLNEINDDWNPENSKRIGNDAFFRIEHGVTIGVKFTYELIDEKAPIDIIFYVLEEDDRVITIEIN